MCRCSSQLSSWTLFDQSFCLALPADPGTTEIHKVLTHTFDKKKGHMQKEMNLKVSKSGEIWVEAADDDQGLGGRVGAGGGDDDDDNDGAFGVVEPANAKDRECSPTADGHSSQGEGSDRPLSENIELKEFKEWTWSEPGDTIVDTAQEEFEMSSGYDELKMEEGLERLDARAIEKALREETQRSNGMLKSEGGVGAAPRGREGRDGEKEDEEDEEGDGDDDAWEQISGVGARGRAQGIKGGLGGGLGGGSTSALGEDAGPLDKDLSWAILDLEWERAEKLLQDGASTAVLDRHLLEVCPSCPYMLLYVLLLRFLQHLQLEAQTCLR